MSKGTSFMWKLIRSGVAPPAFFLVGDVLI